MLSLTFTYQWFAFSWHFSTNSTYSTDNLVTRLNTYIHSAICKLKNIVWWSSWVQINPYTSRSFLDHVSSAPRALRSFPPPMLPWMVSSHSSVSHFSPYVSPGFLQHTISWPSSKASTHCEHRFVCWRKRACFEPSTWPPLMMMSECHLLAVPWKMCTTLSSSLCCFRFGLSVFVFLFFSLLHHSLFLPLWHCFRVFAGDSEDLCPACRTASGYVFCVNSGNPLTKTRVSLFHLCRWVRRNLESELLIDWHASWGST